MKSKELLLIEKGICLTMLSLSSLNFLSSLESCVKAILQLKVKVYYSYFCKIALVGLQYEPMSFDVQEICFDEEQNILDTREKSRKSQSVTEWCRCGKCGVMDKNIKCLSCVEIETLRYLQLSVTRYDHRNAVTKRVSTAVLQLDLI